VTAGVPDAGRVRARPDGAMLSVVGGAGPGPGVASRVPPGAEARGRVAVVTGGSSGLGLDLVRALAQRGLRVVLATQSLDRAWAALDRLGDLADRVAARQLDVTDPDSVARLAGWVDRRLGRCDALVNNAAVLLDDERSSLDVDLAVVQQTLAVNLLGTWRLVQALGPLMRRNHYGRIVNISSGLGSLSAMGPGLPAYRVSQTAINALTRIVAAEFAADDVLVNACCPGAPEVGVVGGPEVVEYTLQADTAVWLATLPDNGPTGGFFRDGQAIAW
jgi:NAD(P)-dependent dehydrogenase (short-subunit alcohol dehydrogenase family)